MAVPNTEMVAEAGVSVYSPLLWQSSCTAIVVFCLVCMYEVEVLVYSRNATSLRQTRQYIMTPS